VRKRFFKVHIAGNKLCTLLTVIDNSVLECYYFFRVFSLGISIFTVFCSSFIVFFFKCW